MSKVTWSVSTANLPSAIIKAGGVCLTREEDGHCKSMLFSTHEEFTDALGAMLQHVAARLRKEMGTGGG